MTMIGIIDRPKCCSFEKDSKISRDDGDDYYEYEYVMMKERRRNTQIIIGDAAAAMMMIGKVVQDRKFG